MNVEWEVQSSDGYNEIHGAFVDVCHANGWDTQKIGVTLRYEKTPLAWFEIENEECPEEPHVVAMTLQELKDIVSAMEEKVYLEQQKACV